MPLRSITLFGTAVTDLRPLIECATLRDIVLPAGALDVGALRSMAALFQISYEYREGGTPAQLAAEFWEEYDGKKK